MKSWKISGLFAALASAAALSVRDESVDYPDYDLLAKCPGYKVAHVHESHSGVKADLTLAGKPCNVYGYDIKDLTLEVSYETGKSWSALHSRVVE